MVVVHEFSGRFVQDVGVSPPLVVMSVVGTTQLCSLLVEVRPCEHVEQESVQVPASPELHQKQGEDLQSLGLLLKEEQSIWFWAQRAN